MLKALTRVKPVSAGDNNAKPGETGLKRVLTARHLIFLGIGVVIGAGIFILTGQAAATYAGPAVTISFVLASLTCALAGLCYAEFSAMLPLSGSAYAYAYAALGEGVAWLIAWCLVLEYLFSAATVSIGWSAYTQSFLTHTLGLDFPHALSTATLAWEKGRFVFSGAIVDLPACLLIVGLSWVLYRSVSQTARLNSIMVVVKLVVVLLFVVFACAYVNPANWHPFMPKNTGPGEFGWPGVIRAATIAFFSYIGFDAVSTAAGETKNPQRNVPIGILGSLALCTLLYVSVCLVLTGLVPYPELNTVRPVATALSHYPQLSWLRVAVEIGAVAGLFSVVMVLLMAQSRIFYTMAKDGLVPSFLGKVHRKYNTPYLGTVVVGVLATVLAGLLPISVLGALVSMGTLLAFATVCIGVLVLRYTQPELERPFRVPAAKVIAPLEPWPACICSSRRFPSIG